MSKSESEKAAEKAEQDRQYAMQQTAREQKTPPPPPPPQQS
ncbi:hypothetical protein [Rubripirellula reticaptiva]|uniref:Uncharacterized protein n=1 Tax=Rubripirellula reticaptiva TaxID=2528013 RepID=A0A5C6EPA3_9BACT|nr:hypothetical protein [Rubripirellula reticaptiva]TWU49446.1 hypothetical protein Poly59_40610 [Rubripirellula reticaptiva]